MSNLKPIDSVCVYCGASNAADPDFIAAAATFGKQLADEGIRLVYGGGGVGLMGACAKAVHNNGGAVLGVMPEFLRTREVLYDDVETIVVHSMHERKKIMYDEADAFAVLPGGIGTLEEVVELMSWARLSLHSKPIVFLNMKNYWAPLFDLLTHTVEAKMTPVAFMDRWRSVDTVEELLPRIRTMAAGEEAAEMPLVT
jgi:uncharacterized protein (TIGR00730 family)